MRIPCPLCGLRDRREFYYSGAAMLLDRPAADAAPDAWTDYIHLRDNPAGVTRDLWYHETGCAAWLVVTRDTVTHAVQRVELVAPPDPGVPAAIAGASGGNISAKMKSPRKKKGAPDAA